MTDTLRVLAEKPADDLVARLKARKMLFRMDNDPHWYMSADDFDDDCQEAAARIARLEGALRFILAFYEPGQRHLDTEAWKVAEAGARAALAASHEMKKAPPISERGQVD